MTISYRVEIEQEDDGRFLAEVVDLPGVLASGETRRAGPGSRRRRSRCACWPIASSTTSGPRGP